MKAEKLEENSFLPDSQTTIFVLPQSIRLKILK